VLAPEKNRQKEPVVVSELRHVMRKQHFSELLVLNGWQPELSVLIMKIFSFISQFLKTCPFYERRFSPFPRVSELDVPMQKLFHVKRQCKINGLIYWHDICCAFDSEKALNLIVI